MECCQRFAFCSLVTIVVNPTTICSCRARYNYAEETVNSALQPGELVLLSGVYFPIQ